MVTRTRKTGEEGTDTTGAAADLAGTVKASAQQIWLAGLGAFSKAQEEGGKVFQALVKEGLTLQRHTQGVAEGKLSEATSRMASMATELSSKASGQWDRLEGLFEERVRRALKQMGMPTARDLEALAARIDELERTVASLRGGAAGARSAAHSAARKPPLRATAKAAKVARKRVPPRKLAP